MSKPFEVDITPEGRRSLNKLPEKVRPAAIETILGSIAHNPKRAGKALSGELEGLHSARRGDFRIIYQIDAAERVVVILRVQHRRDVYRPR